MNRMLSFCTALVLLLTPLPAMALDITARSCILIEAETGKVLYAQDPHAKLPMASTTKIMTALVAIENGNLDEIVTVDASAYGTEGSSIYLEMEEELSLKDLLYGLMLSSGNDAAVAIAVHIGQGVATFADMMNRRAKAIGAVNTNFVTPNGLHNDSHYTTAYDMALIAAEALKNPTFRQIVSTEYYRSETGSKARTFKNKNKILWEYDGGTGVKTGYTKAAGRCLVFSAERDGMEVVGVVLNCPDMFGEAKALMDYGFDNYELHPLLVKGQNVARTAVDGGEKKMLELVAARDIMVPVEKNGSQKYRTSVILSDGLRAPISKGQVLGRVEILQDGALLAKCDLLAKEDIPGAGIVFYFNKITSRFAAA